MDRRTLLKSSVALLGALSLSGQGALARAQSVAQRPAAPDADHPLALNFNENALGMSAQARQAIVAALPGAFRYPDAAREALITALASEMALTPAHLSLGNGSSECIRAILQAQAIAAQRRGRAVQLVVPDPTFNYAELCLQPLGVEVVKVPLDAQLGFRWQKCSGAPARLTACRWSICVTQITRRRPSPRPMRWRRGSPRHRRIPSLSSMRPMPSLSAIRPFAAL